MEKELLCEENLQYQEYLRNRITELREQRGVSEYRLSLELGKSGSYIRSITCGSTLPSLKELFNIFTYFEISPPGLFCRTGGSKLSARDYQGKAAGHG